uniref:Uncharacterized protein n=1 Tax=Anguilla anguilla TaxID=7936 RepID=A0A0E9Q7F2_ANGAN
MIYIIYIQPIYYRKCTLERMKIPASKQFQQILKPYSNLLVFYQPKVSDLIA